MTDHFAPDRVDFETMFGRLTAAIGGPEELQKRYRALDFELFGLTLAEIFRTPGAATIIGMLLIEAQERDQEIIALTARLGEIEASLEMRGDKWNQQTIGHLIAWTARELRVSATAIRGESRDAKLVVARQAIAWAARELFGFSFPRIARALGDRDHTTILWSVRRAGPRRDIDPDFRDLTDRLVAAFGKAQS